MALNVVALQGRLTADAELKTTTSGISVTSFTVALDRGKDKDGNDRGTDFIPVVAWRQTAEFISKYFRKGSMIAIAGSLQSRNYEDKNGNKRTAIEVVVDSAHFCGSKAETGGATQQQANIDVHTNPQEFSSVDVEDDLPF